MASSGPPLELSDIYARTNLGSRYLLQVPEGSSGDFIRQILTELQTSQGPAGVGYVCNRLWTSTDKTVDGFLYAPGYRLCGSKGPTYHVQADFSINEDAVAQPAGNGGPQGPPAAALATPAQIGTGGAPPLSSSAAPTSSSEAEGSDSEGEEQQAPPAAPAAAAAPAPAPVTAVAAGAAASSSGEDESSSGETESEYDTDESSQANSEPAQAQAGPAAAPAEQSELPVPMATDALEAAAALPASVAQEAAELVHMTEAPGELPGSADTKPATDAKPEAVGAASEPQASDNKTSVQLQRGQEDSKSLPGNPGTETGASAQPAAQSVQHSLPAAEPSQPASGSGPSGAPLPTLTEATHRSKALQASKKGQKRPLETGAPTPSSGGTDKPRAPNGLTVEQDSWLALPLEKLNITQLRCITSGMFKIARLAERRLVGDSSKQPWQGGQPAWWPADVAFASKVMRENRTVLLKIYDAVKPAFDAHTPAAASCSA